jgi:hypothetical protein
VEAKDKLDQDFNNFNLDIERKAEEEIQKIRSDVNALKEQAAKMGEALMNPSVVSEKSS